MLMLWWRLLLLIKCMCGLLFIIVLLLLPRLLLPIIVPYHLLLLHFQETDILIGSGNSLFLIQATWCCWCLLPKWIMWVCLASTTTSRIRNRSICWITTLTMAIWPQIRLPMFILPCSFLEGCTYWDMGMLVFICSTTGYVIEKVCGLLDRLAGLLFKLDNCTAGHETSTLHIGLVIGVDTLSPLVGGGFALLSRTPIHRGYAVLLIIIMDSACYSAHAIRLFNRFLIICLQQREILSLLLVGGMLLLARWGIQLEGLSYVIIFIWIGLGLIHPVGAGCIHRVGMVKSLGRLGCWFIGWIDGCRLGGSRMVGSWWGVYIG